MVRKLFLVSACCVVAASLAAALDVGQLPNPLKDVAVGQWILYPVSWDESEGDQKQTVTSIEGEGDDRVLTVRKEIIIDGNVVETEEFSAPYNELIAEMHEMFDEAADATVSSTTLEVNGKTIDCVLLTYTEDNIECKIYLSEEIPITGIVRFEMEGLDRPVMAVKDFKK